MSLLPLLLIADTVRSVPPDNDFSPAAFFIVLCFFAVFLILVGIGVAVGVIVGLIGMAVATMLVAVGIVSSSALVAFWQRRFSAGLRALHYQLCAVAAMPGGVCLLWLGSGLLEYPLHHRYILFVGALAGAAAGLLLAAVLDGFGRFACRRLLLTLRLPRSST